MTTVALIAAEAFTDVAAELTDVIKSCTLTKTTLGAYNATTGAHATTTSSVTGRAVAGTERAIQDIFPAYVVGPRDVLFYLEGLSSPPAENDTLTVNSVDYTITQVGDIVNASTFFAVVARGR